jgi:DNA-binding response OmpR family regulator
MAAILIVASDGALAKHMVRTLRQAGHTPILAPDARSALQEAPGCADLILLDVPLPDLPGEDMLRRLERRAETAHIPVLAFTAGTEAAAQLRGAAKGSAAHILLKPVSGAQLLAAVHSALAGQKEEDADALRLARQRQQDLIRRLILEGSDPLVFHVHRRLCADRTGIRGPIARDALTWAEIAEWARHEGLVDADQARLLRRAPTTGPKEAGENRA